ncbi:Dihydrolipoamide dehydrogenase [Candidatus Johnevansia muelleri]|uniref:Dihydrolipoyl dehydrogenase n=1 Tax=Candidatus Johnevansia muelleri TaxID=1495769 RepID=A0A078KEF3_9GAMM|nr:Dihydrolipoamide dehydrogenase [Candidatus Evansia muelleri]
MSDKYDVIIIGTGPGGYVAGIRAAQLGLKTACIEKWVNIDGNIVYGGTCLNVGCIPSKALLEISYNFVNAIEKFELIGINVSNITIDIIKMINSKNKTVATINRGISAILKNNNITVIEGIGKVLSSNKVEVTGKNCIKNILNTDNIIIATGSVPIETSVAPVNGDTIVDSSGALNFTAVPDHLGIIGAGAIGIEIGSVWNRLGSKVTILESESKFLHTVDEDLSKEAYKLFTKQGIDIQLGAIVISSKINDKKIQVIYTKDNSIKTIVFDKLIVSIGRRPCIDNILYSSAGVVIDEKKFIQVNEHCKTNVSGIYAIGDVVRGPMLAHKASEEGVMVANIIAGHKSEINYNTIPNVIYTYPEIAWVGKNEQNIKTLGIEYKIGTFPFYSCGRSMATNSTEGFIKIIANAKTDRILGIHILGQHAGELIANGVIAMEFGASAEDIALTCFAHPTLSESIREAALAVSGNAINIVNRNI